MISMKYEVNPLFP